MALRLDQILSVNNVENTPMIPSYNNFGKNCSRGQRHFLNSRNQWTPCFGKKVHKKLSHIEKMAIELEIEGNYSKKKLLNKVIKKGSDILKSRKNTKERQYMIKHCKQMSKKMGIKKGNKSYATLWKEISTQLKKQSYEDYNSFGTWWDNTQQLYGGNGAQSADTSSLNGSFPFYTSDNWQPYQTIRGNSFGGIPYNTPFIGEYPMSIDSPYPFVL